MNILDDEKEWLFTPPRFRRFLILTGWVVFITIPPAIVWLQYAVSGGFASMYGVLGSVLGGLTGIYMWDRGRQDTIVAQNFPFHSVGNKLSQWFLGNGGSRNGDSASECVESVQEVAEDSRV